MHSPGRHLMLAYGLPLLILLGGGAVLVWPVWQKRSELQMEIEDLTVRMAGISDQTEVVESLAAQLNEVREEILPELKEIGRDANSSDIANRLSMPVDGINVIDSRFSRGSTRPATNDENETMMAMAQTVEMEATFDSIYAVVRAAESMPRLVRVTSVIITTMPNAPDVPGGSPILKATITLDSIYEPLDEEGA